MLISFHGKITERDLIRIFSLATKSKRWQFFILSPLVLIFAGLTYLNLEHAIFYPYVALAAFFGIMSAYPLWGPRASASTAYRRQTEMKGNFEGFISDQEILLRTANTSQNIKWVVWKRVVRNQDMVLLFQSNNCFNFFPRPFFASDEDWQEFQRLLDEKIKSGALKK